MQHPEECATLLSPFPNVQGLLHPKCLSTALKQLNSGNILLFLRILV